MQVQVRTINVICAVLLVLAGFLIDNKVDARAIKRRSSDLSAEEYKRALIDALAYALGKSYGRREEQLWTETDTSGVAPGTLDIPDSNLWTETDTSGAAPGTLSDNTIPSNFDPTLWTETDTSGVAPGTLDIPNSNLWTETDTSGAAPGTLDIPDPNLWTEVASRAAKAKAVRKIKATLVKRKQTAGKGKQPTARKHH